MPIPIDYDEEAVAHIQNIERILDRLPLDDHDRGAFLAILNALEYQVESGDTHPSVVRHLGDALLAIAALRSFPPAATKSITQVLGTLHSHIAARP